MSQNKLKTVNSENCCPLSRKRMKPIGKSTNICKLSKLEQAESLQEMGVGMLDSEESSSSISSTIVLAMGLASDENSNEATPHVDAPLFYHNNNLNYHHSIDSSLDNSDINLTFNESKSSFKKSAGDNTIHSFIKRNANVSEVVSPHGITNTNLSVSPSTNSNSRSPLATVATNSQNRNTQKNVGNSASYSHESGMHVSTNTTRSQSPSSLPSTSQQAYLLKQQQKQLQHLQRPQHLLKQMNTNDTLMLLTRKGKDPNVAPARDYFNAMSDEIILHIFKFLPKKALFRCNLVCRRFNNCAKDSSLWTRLDLGGRTLRPHVLEYILTRGVVILRLAQAELKHPVFDPLVVSNNPPFQTKLQYLDLSMTTISKLSLQLLLSRCSRLRKLSLEHVPLNDDICQEIAKNVHLEALNLTMCTGLEAWSIRKMLESLKNLSSLNISWTNLSVDAVSSVVSTVSSNLFRLNVAGCRKTMFDTHLSTLVKRCPQLLELDLSDCTGLSSNAITIICKFKMLEYLSLSRCYLIPAASYMELKNMKSLNYLDVFGLLSDSAMEMLELYLPALGINRFHHSSVARPTVGTRRTSIWGLRTRD